ncbi:MAG: sterol desaturase family protein [Bacteroidia bacterium]|nr:sterol desaturase family protein [Bacteroidia bacterium]
MAGKPRKDRFSYPQVFFKQPWEWLSRYRDINTYVVMVFYGLISTGMLIYAWLGQGLSGWVMGALFLGGLLTWTLAEYILHRFVLHYVEDSPIIQRWHNFMHGAHHDVPRDLRFVTASPFITLPIALLFWGLFWLLLGWTWVWAFYAGFGIGYVLYEYVHYAIHRYPHPPFPFLRGLWQNHNLHHFKAPEKRFGVTTTLWDRIFGTYEVSP